MSEAVLAILRALACGKPRALCDCAKSLKKGHGPTHCPLHDDEHPSLSVTEVDGKLLVYCHAGCLQDAVIEKLRELGLWHGPAPRGERGNGNQPTPRQEDTGDPLEWWAKRCGVPLEWVKRLPIEARDGAVAFRWPGLSTRKLRSQSTKGWWQPEDSPRPHVWPALPDAAPPVLVLCEGESDATVAAYALEAAGLQGVAAAHGVTKGASAHPDQALLREVARRGFRAVLLVPDADRPGETWGQAWTKAAKEAGLAAAVLDLAAQRLVAPSLGESDLRDAFHRHPVRVMAALKEAVGQLDGAEIRFSPYKGGGWAETNFPLVTAAELLAQPQTSTDWLWRGYLPRGGMALLSARAKQGKTTLVGHLLRAMLNGEPFLGIPTSLSPDEKVAVLSEETPGLVADRLRSLGLLSDRLLLAFRHHSEGLSMLDLAQQAIEAGAVLVVVDTMTAWTGIEDENSAPEVEANLRPIISLCQARGASLLLLHPLRKSDGPEGTAHRGSGHLVAMADVALELRRTDGNTAERRRVLTALSRYQETPEELVIELGEEGYTALGTRPEVVHSQARAALLDVMPGPGEEPVPFESSREKDTLMGRLAEAGLKFPRTPLQRALDELVTSGQVERLGEGKKGAPFVYRLPSKNSFQPNPHSYMGGNELKPPGDAATPGGAALIQARAPVTPPKGKGRNGATAADGAAGSSPEEASALDGAGEPSGKMPSRNGKQLSLFASAGGEGEVPLEGALEGDGHKEVKRWMI